MKKTCCKIILFIYIICHFMNEIESTCNSEGRDCTEPMERSLERYQHVLEFNMNCSVGQLPYFIDDNRSLPNSCGECIPGTSGVEDDLKSCGVNQYCGDNAKCKDLVTHPLYLVPCPYESVGPSYLGWCGPGLRCYQHLCVICLDGQVDTDGKRCVNGRWSYSMWANFWYEPTNVLLLFLVIVMICILLKDLFFLIRLKTKPSQTVSQTDYTFFDQSSNSELSESEEDELIHQTFNNTQSLDEASMIEWR